MAKPESASLSDLDRKLGLGHYAWMFIGATALSMIAVLSATATAPEPDRLSTGTLMTETFDVTLTWPASPQTHDAPFIVDAMVRSGDTLDRLFQRLGVNDPEAARYVLTSEPGRNALRKLRAGLSARAAIRADGQLQQLILPQTHGYEFHLARSTDGFESQSIGGSDKPIVQTVIEMRSGTIERSLFGATDAAGIPDNIAVQFAEIFGTEIDFYSDLREGDSFSVVYEMHIDNAGATRTGAILAAEFVNRGKRSVVARYTDNDGRRSYYTADGRSLRKGFLRAPLEFSRISSSFGKRFHPIHKRWRSHNGVDFAAPTGTPVKAASDGTIEYVGSQRGYGNIVVIAHRNQYDTAYAHLNGFARGLRRGQAVSQGDIIGYVGQTGWATGPHLHYEVRIRDVPHNPMTIELPRATQLAADEKQRFLEHTEPALNRLALLKRTTVASLR